MSPRPRIGVFKFASCDGCQLSLLDAEDELLPLCDKIEIAHFAEASSRLLDGPYDVSLAEGSITTPHDAERILEVRRQSRFLVTIGACATSGGIQALRNFARHDDWMRWVYPRPDYIESLATSTAIADHVAVDFELRGCPVNRFQLVDVILAYAEGRTPRVSRHSVCLDCKRRGTVCITVARGEPCLGPLTQSGCGAICPAYDRGCYGCFGPAFQNNAASLIAHLQTAGATPRELIPLLQNFNTAAGDFRRAAESIGAESLEANVTGAGAARGGVPT